MKKLATDLPNKRLVIGNRDSKRLKLLVVVESILRLVGGGDKEFSFTPDVRFILLVRSVSLLYGNQKTMESLQDNFLTILQSH